MGKPQTAPGGNVFAFYNCLVFALSTTNNFFFFNFDSQKIKDFLFAFSPEWEAEAEESTQLTYY